MMRPVYFLSILFIAHSVTFSQKNDSALHFTGASNGAIIPFSTSLTPQKITISCWLRPEVQPVSNRPQTILSKGFFSTIDDFADPSNWEIYNATDQGSAKNMGGFVGAVFDGRYTYFSPWRIASPQEWQSGRVLRYDTHYPYGDSTSWSVYNAENEDGEDNVRGLEGAVFDGRYIYFVPLHHEGTYHSKVLRFDTQKEFNDSDSWNVFNAGDLDPDGNLKGFVGAVYDGQFVYFIPNPFFAHSKVLRLDTRREFLEDDSWSIYDLSNFNGEEYPGGGFFGGIFDGTYLYFIPFNSKGNVLRLNTRENFLDSASWSSVSLQEIFAGSSESFANNFAGSVFDGRYIYFSPIKQGNVVRYDTYGDFQSAESWEMSVVIDLDGQRTIHGGIGPTFDGRYVYFPPMYDDVGRSGKTVIYDSYSDFTDLSSWRFMDLSTLDPDLKGFEGSVYDGHYVYFAPMNFDNPHGKIPRYNTNGTNGLSYVLQLSHPSSSFGSTQHNLTFRVGTTLGVRSVGLKTDENLADGQWHHVAVTYDGAKLQIFLDGILNNTLDYGVQADIIANESNLSVGKLEGAPTSYQGDINNLSIWNTAFQEQSLEMLITEDLSFDSDSLIGYWPFDNAIESGIVFDTTANGDSILTAPAPEFKPVISAGHDETACPSAIDFTLTGHYPAGGVWSGTGVSSDGIFSPTPDLAGKALEVTYTITQSFGSIIKSFSSTKLVKVDDFPVVHGTDGTLCELPEITLTTDDGFLGYLWSTGEETTSIQVTTPGNYSVLVQTASGCELESQPFIIQQGSELPTPTIDRTNLLTLQASPEGTAYEWFNHGSLLQQDSPFLNVSDGGEYSVRIADASGCFTQPSQAYQISNYEISKIMEKPITLYPNPTSGQFRIGFIGSPSTMHIMVVGVQGQHIYSADVSLDASAGSIPVDLSGLADGLYAVHIRTPQFKVVRKLHIRH